MTKPPTPPRSKPPAPASGSKKPPAAPPKSDKTVIAKDAPSGKLPPRSGKAPAPPAKPAVEAKPKFEVKVRYFARTRPQQVGPLTVETTKAPGAVPLTVRPVLPGAQVVPEEQRLEPGRTVTFQVTPLARGWLTDARLEVAQTGRPTLLMPLRIKSVTQRLTWALLALTLLLPVGLAYYTDPGLGQLQGTIPVELKIKPGDPVPPGRAGQPGEVLAHYLDRSLTRSLPAFGFWSGGPDALRPRIIEMLNGWAKSLELGALDTRKSLVAGLAGGTYQFLCNLEEARLPFLLGAGLLLATVLSWVTHWKRRAWAAKTLEPAATESPTGILPPPSGVPLKIT